MMLQSKRNRARNHDRFCPWDCCRTNLPNAVLRGREKRRWKRDQQD